MPHVYDELPFEIDHVVAEQHGGRTVASNLALACFADNHHTPGDRQDSRFQINDRPAGELTRVT